MNLVLILPKVQGQQTPCSLSPLFTPQPDDTKFISIITVWVDAIFFICKWYGSAKGNYWHRNFHNENSIAISQQHLQKLTEHLQLQTMAEWILILFGGCKDIIKCSTLPNSYSIS